MLLGITLLVIWVLTIIFIMSFAETWIGYILTFIGGAILGVFVGLIIGSIVLWFVGIFPDRELVKTGEERIVAINDNNNIEGKFFLGSGQVNNKMVYHYISDTDGEMTIETLPVNKVKLVYSNEPRIEIYKEEFKGEKAKYWLYSPIDSDTQYKIYIPKGSIKSDFVIDLQ